MLCEEALFPALSSVCCASASMFMPFVCVGSTRAVIIIAFFKERHNDICIFACKITRLGKSAFGKRTEGEPDSPWQGESGGEDGFVFYERPCRMAGICGCSLKHSSACPSPRGDQRAHLILAADWLRFRGARKMMPSANKTVEITEAEDSSYAIGFVRISELSHRDLVWPFLQK